MNPNAPSNRDINLLTGIGLILLSAATLLIWHLTGGGLRQFPALLGWGLLIYGGLLLFRSLRRRRSRRR